ncbi:(deoxy)nucleoside triphosphate pyrophosphohydrolase [Tsuneonella sp. HG249]
MSVKYCLTVRFWTRRVKKRFPGRTQLEKNPTWIVVVAGALSDKNGRLLVQRRPAGKQHGGLWEFPGGKVEKGESPRAALIRELNEELGITVSPSNLAPAAFAESQPAAGDPGIVILLYRVADFEGMPVAEEGSSIGWFSLEQIAELPLPPLDLALLSGLQRGER